MNKTKSFNISIASIAFYLITFVCGYSPAFAQSTSQTIEDGGTGAHKAIVFSEQSLPTHTIFRPADLSVFGENNKLPVIAWGNGACANSPEGHVNFLNEVASHGFLVVAIGKINTNEGERSMERSTSSQLIDGMDDFERIDHVPVFVANLDVGHGGTYMEPHGGKYATVATAWYQWQLKGDQEAAKMFTGENPGISKIEGWRYDKKNMD